MQAQWLARELQKAKHIVIFTGAGMSTESGVPDFRSATGFWQGVDPQSLASTTAMVHNRTQFIEFYRMRMQRLDDIVAHDGYHILTAWGERFPLKAIITQNTDGLHERAGNRHVIPIHGTIRHLHCNRCSRVYSVKRYYDAQTDCECGGFIRPSVILFGESLDGEILVAAEQQARQADLFIVLGSSLVVSPANMFPVMAKENGAKMAIVNRDPTPLDMLADCVVNDRNIGPFLQEVNSLLDGVRH